MPLRPLPPARSYGSESEAVVLDTCSVHELVDVAAFERERVLELVPPEGHFALMTYRRAGEGLPTRPACFRSA